MKKFYLFAIIMFVFAMVNAQLPMLESMPDFLPPPPGPPDACDMGGTYSIGPGGDYITITEALDTLNSRGVSTNVILELTASYNSNAETFPIRFPKESEIPCFSSFFTITLRPATGVLNAVISGASRDAVILLDSCNYVTIDGRPGGIGTSNSLTIHNDSAAPAIRFFDASGNIVRYTNLSGGVTGFGLYTGVVNMQGLNGLGCDNNSLQFCKLYSAVTNPFIKDVMVYSSSSGPAVVNNNDSILNCEFYNFGKSAVQIENYSEGWVMRGNSFYGNESVEYADDVFVIKINTPASEVLHTIEDNSFGGTAPGCQGNPMNINYKNKFYFADINGVCKVANNKFARLNFENTENRASYEIRMVNITSFSNIVSSVITNNTFGGHELADSIHFNHNYNNNYVTAALITADCSITYYILKNNFVNIRCYSPAGGGVTLAPVLAINGAAAVWQNKIGDVTIENSITNNTNGPTYGVYAIGAAAKINDNTICRITATYPGTEATVQGIYTNRGFIDSISRNKIFHLIANLAPVSAYAPLTGISANPDFGGGVANAITDNVIHSLHNKSAYQGGIVTGIHVSRNTNIKRNFIHSLNTSDAFSVTVYGINIPDKESVLENNMISLGTDSLGNSITAGNISFYGIVGGHVLRHNSVYVGGTSVQNGFLGSGCFLFIGSALNTEYHNNIFVNNRSNANVASSAKHQCINIDLSYTGNYNMFYANGQGGIIGTYQNTRYNTLAQWRAGSGKDANSIFNDPFFVQPAGSAPAVNLHLSYGTPAESVGNSNYTVAVDYDKESRASLTPVDIGADAGNYAICPVADAGPDYFLFEGGDVHLGSLPIPNVSYLWTGPNGFSSTLSNPIITPQASGQYTLVVTSGSCSSSDVVYISVMPAPVVSFCPGSNVFLTADNTSASAYQWQVNTGNTIYTNISNNANYTGVNNDTLYIADMPSAWYGYKYRCVTDGVNGVARKVQFLNTWTGAADNLWSNPANWSCNALPDGNTDVVINSGTVILNQNGICRTLYVAPSANFTINTGFNLIITH
jgi:trimeric autotransporter adhesin